MKLHELTEDAWDDAETRRSTPNPLPVADEATLYSVLDLADDLENKLVLKYRAGKDAKTPYPELSRRVRQELGNVINVPISKIIASEEFLDGQHLRALAGNQPTTSPSGAVTLIKAGDKYYVQDGNHRVAAAAVRGDDMIKALVIDVGSI